MTCYLIIYTRTSCCDYYPNFHVIPDFVDANEVRPYILSATTDLDPTEKNPKEIIISNGKYCVWGYICFSKDFANEQDMPYTRDNKGRAVYGFFGFAAKLERKNTVPVLSMEKCANIFRKYIIPVWNDTVPESKIPAPVQTDEKEMVSGLPQADFSNKNTCYYTEKSDLFNALISSVFKYGTKISCCSSIQDYDKLKDCIYNHVVTTSNLIYRLKSAGSDAHMENKIEDMESIVSAPRVLSPQDEIRLMMQGKITPNSVQSEEAPANEITVDEVTTDNTIIENETSKPQSTKVTVKPVAKTSQSNPKITNTYSNSTYNSTTNSSYYNQQNYSGKKKQYSKSSSTGSQNSSQNCSAKDNSNLISYIIRGLTIAVVTGLVIAAATSDKQSNEKEGDENNG